MENKDNPCIDHAIIVRELFHTLEESNYIVCIKYTSSSYILPVF